jgi:hypothetical protein
MKLVPGMTKQGVRNLSDFGPKKKKLKVDGSLAAEPAGPATAAPQVVPEAPIVATVVTTD